MINRHNIWVGLAIETLCGASAVYAANWALQYLVSSQLVGVIGHAISMITISNRPFELSPPLAPQAQVNPLTCKPYQSYLRFTVQQTA
jgi:hypothetical protein